MKKKWIPLAIVAAVAAVIFFSRSIYTYTLPKITAETAAPGQFQYRLSVQHAALEGEGAWDVRVPTGLEGTVAFQGVPVLGETFDAGDVILQTDSDTQRKLRDAAQVRRGEIAALLTGHTNAASSARRRLRQLDAEIPELEAVLAADCTELPEMKELAGQVRRAGGSRKAELQAQYEKRRQELITMYTDTLEMRGEERRTVADTLARLEAGYYEGQSIEALAAEAADLDRFCAMLDEKGLVADVPLTVAEVYGAAGDALAGGGRILRLVPADSPVYLAVEVIPPEGMGDFASACTLWREDGGSHSFTVAHREFRGGGLRLVMEVSETVPAGKWTSVLLKGPMHPCVIPASALIGGAGVYRVDSWETTGGMERLRLYYTPVTVGQVYNGQAVIESGIYSGDKVVTAWDRAIGDGAEAAWAR